MSSRSASRAGAPSPSTDPGVTNHWHGLSASSESGPGLGVSSCGDGGRDADAEPGRADRGRGPVGVPVGLSLL